MTTHAHDELLHTARVHAYQPNITHEAAKKICKGYLEQRSQLATLTKQRDALVEAFIGDESLGKFTWPEDAWAAIEEELNNRYNDLEAETNDENNFENNG